MQGSRVAEELSSLQERFSVLIAQNKEDRMSIGGLKGQLDEANRKVAEAAAERQSLQDRFVVVLQKCRDERTELTARIAAQDAELARKTDEWTRKENELTERASLHKARLGALEKELEDTRQKNESLKSNNTSQAAKLAELELQLAGSREHVVELRALKDRDIADLQKRCADLQQAVNSRDVRLFSLEQELDSIKRKASAYEEAQALADKANEDAVVRSERELAAARRSAQTMDEQRTALIAEQRSLRDRVATLEAAAEESRQREAKAQAELLAARRAEQELQRLRAAEFDTKRLEEELSNSKQTLASCNKVLEGMRKQVQEQGARERDARRMAGGFVAQLDAVKAEHAKAVARCEDLAAYANKQHKRIEELERAAAGSASGEAPPPSRLSFSDSGM